LSSVATSGELRPYVNLQKEERPERGGGETDARRKVIAGLSKEQHLLIGKREII